MDKNSSLPTVIVIGVIAVIGYYIYQQNRVQNAVINATQGGVATAASGIGAGIGQLASGLGSGIGSLFSGGFGSGGSSSYTTASDDSSYAYDPTDDTSDDFMG